VHRLIVVSVAAAAALSLGACRKTAEPAPAATATTPADPAAPVKPMPAQLPDVLARVNGEAVTKANFDMLIKNMELGGGPIPAERRDEVLRTSLDRLITYTLLTQEAQKRDVTPSDTEVEQRLAEMRQQFPDQAAFQKALGERGMTVERLKADTRTDLAISKMMDAQVASVGEATDADAQDFYDKNPEKFKQGEQVRASHILLLVDEQADEAKRTKARTDMEALLKKARAGEDFGNLARAHSQDGSAAQGGDLGFFPRGQMVPAFDEVAFSLKPGEISDVVTTQFGYHIIKVTERKDASTVPLDQVKGQVKQFLTAQKKQQQADQFIAGLREKSTIEVLV
jgi:peptidyl-prolyl cis-trans isomerase C